MALAVDFQAHRPVVLLHAFPLNRRMWQPQMGALNRAGFSPIAVDLPGFGESRLAGESSLSDFAASILKTLDRWGIRRAAWVGLSMGGYVLLRVLEVAPERVAAAVLANTRAEADTPEARARRYDQASRVATLGPEAIVEGFLASALGAATHRERPEVVSRVRELVLGAPAAGVVNALRAMASRPDSTGLLPSVRVPVLVVAGHQDSLTPLPAAQTIASAIPGARLVALEGSGHLSNLEVPEAFNRALIGFLESVAPEPATR